MGKYSATSVRVAASPVTPYSPIRLFFFPLPHQEVKGDEEGLNSGTRDPACCNTKGYALVHYYWQACNEALQLNVLGRRTMDLESLISRAGA